MERLIEQRDDLGEGSVVANVGHGTIFSGCAGVHQQLVMIRPPHLDPAAMFATLDG